MISDHLRPWITRTGHAPFVWTTLGAIAQATERIEVGTGVTAIVHRNTPVTVAHAAATAAVLFEGRFFLGVGTGERLNEQAFGRHWPRPAARRAQLREAIGLVRRLVAGETVDHRG
jgi:G6PDH family F420-dependent oxidoreductase